MQGITSLSHDRTACVDELYKAAREGHVSAIECLLLSQAEDEPLNESITNALQLAAEHGHAKAIDRLIKFGAAVNFANGANGSALHRAARHGHKDAVATLLKNSADLGILDDEGWTALDWAVNEAQDAIVSCLLIASKAKVDSNANAERALRLAAEEGHASTIQTLLDFGVNVNSRDGEGSTAMDWAVSMGNTSAVRTLVDQGASLVVRDSYGNTCLHWSIEYPEILELLLQNGVVVDAQNESGQTALRWAAQQGLLAATQALLDHGANLNLEDQHGLTPLHGAALRGHTSIVRLLLANNANANAIAYISSLRVKPLHLTAIYQHTDTTRYLRPRTRHSESVINTIQALLRQPLTVSRTLATLAEATAANTIVTGLRICIQTSRLRKLDFLLHQGADPDEQDPGGWTGLLMAASDAASNEDFSVRATRLLLRYNADPNLAGWDGKGPLHLACEQGLLGVVQELINAGANLEASAYMIRPLHLAAQSGRANVVDVLVNAGADVDSFDPDKRTPLHWAAVQKWDNVRIHQTLIDAGADVNAVDRWGQTALMLALEGLTYVDLAMRIVQRGPSVDTRSSDGSTALHRALLQIEELGPLTLDIIDLAEDVDVRTRVGFSALHMAVIMGLEDEVIRLLDAGADIELSLPDRGVAASTVNPHIARYGENDQRQVFSGDEQMLCLLERNGIDKEAHSLTVDEVAGRLHGKKSKMMLILGTHRAKMENLKDVVAGAEESV